MKSVCSTGLNTLIEKLLAALKASHRAEKQFLAESNAEAARKIKERRILNVKKPKPGGVLRNEEF